jgi:hypothetical protein
MIPPLFNVYVDQVTRGRRRKKRGPKDEEDRKINGPL